MRYSLETFEIVPESARVALKACGIQNTDDLLTHTALPRQRAELSHSTGIPVVELTRWAGIADLVRIKGIGPSLSQMLVESGLVRNVQELLERLALDNEDGDCATGARASELGSVKRAASMLSEQLVDYSKQNPSIRRVPTAHELAEAAEEAAELRPRFVMAIPDDRAEFNKYLEANYRKESRILWKQSLVLYSVILAVLVFFASACMIWVEHNISEMEALNFGNPSVLLEFQFGRVAYRYSDVSIAMLAVLFLIAVVIILEVFLKVMRYATNVLLVKALFNNPLYRAFYRKTEAMNLEKQVRANRWSMGIVAIVAAGIAVYMFLGLNEGVTAEAQLQRVTLPLALAFIILAIIVSAPRLQFLAQEIRVNCQLDKVAVQRYLVYELRGIITIVVAVLLLTQVAVPLILSAHRSFYQNYVGPNLAAEASKVLSALEYLDVYKQASPEQQGQARAFFEKNILLKYSALVFGATEASYADAIEATRVALNLIVYLVLAALALLFVLPYLILGGWRRGIFFMILVIVNSYSEGVLIVTAPQWFQLEANSTVSTGIIFFVIFANALLLDWIFERVAERKKWCPNCKTQLDIDTQYCSSCGLLVGA